MASLINPQVMYPPGGVYSIFNKGNISESSFQDCRQKEDIPQLTTEHFFYWQLQCGNSLWELHHQCQSTAPFFNSGMGEIVFFAYFLKEFENFSQLKSKQKFVLKFDHRNIFHFMYAKSSHLIYQSIQYILADHI